MSAQPSYQFMMNRMENVSYLVLPTSISSDRSATALKSIQDCTFLLYWIPTHILFWQGKHSTKPHHRCLIIFKYVRAYIFWRCFRVHAIYLLCVGKWKWTVFSVFLCVFLSVCVGLHSSRCDIQAEKEVVSQISILLADLSCRGVKSPSEQKQRKGEIQGLLFVSACWCRGLNQVAYQRLECLTRSENNDSQLGTYAAAPARSSIQKSLTFKVCI